jgi:DinB superfamily
MQRPASTEHAAYYGKYIDLVTETDIVATLAAQLDEVLPFLRAIPESQGNVLHPPYTWSIKHVVGHLTDSERVFGYRALRFARGDATALPGFDENAYARAAESDRRPLADLVAEFEALRRSHVLMFRNLPEAAWSRSGLANNNGVSVRAAAYILVGHVRHHTAILRKRLGN